MDLRRTLQPHRPADANDRPGGLTRGIVGALFCGWLATAAIAADAPPAGSPAADSTRPEPAPSTAAPPIAPVTLPATLPAAQGSGANHDAAAASGNPADTMSATDAYATFRSAFDAGRYLDAVPPAQRVLALAEQAHKGEPAAEEVQVAVMNLAMTQYLAGDYGGAEENYKRAIQLVQDSGRPLHQRLARAYAGLATTYHDGNRHDLAVKNYDQAVALLRRHEGLLTENQIPIVQKYIDSLTELGRLDDALKAQRYILRIVTRKYGENDVRVAPTLVDIGRWFTRVGAYDLARRSLKRATDIIEDAEGDKSPKLVEPLMAVAACAHKQMLDPTQVATASPDTTRPYAFQDPSMAVTYTPATLYAESERALLRAADIAAQRADPVPAQVADVHTQLGDLYQARGQPDRALPHYQQAWQAASHVAQKYDGKPLTSALFGEPVLLQISRPELWDKYSQRPRDEVELRYVRVEFTVTPQGRAADWKVTDDSGDPKRAEKTLDALKTAHYRPRFDNGQPVAATGTVLSQPWYVLLQPEGSKPGNSKQSTRAGARRAGP